MNNTKTRQCSLCQNNLFKGDLYYVNYFCNHTYCYYCVSRIYLPDKIRHKCFVILCNNYVNLIKMDEEFLQQQMQVIQIQDDEQKQQEQMLTKYSDYCGLCFMYQPGYFEQQICKYHKLCITCCEKTQQCRLCLY